MKVAVIGCGVMGSALARHFAHKHSVLLCDHHPAKAQALAKEIGARFEERGARFEERLESAIEEAGVILLAVKPKDLSEVAKATPHAWGKGKTLVSILAGTPLATLKKHFPEAFLVRAMPNLALTCGEGVIGLVGEEHTLPEIKSTLESLLHGLGLLAWMSEDRLEGLTALCGSGIGFVFVMIEAMIDGGVLLGFTAQDARAFVMKTMEGAIALMQETGKWPAELRREVSSPGGTTIAGLKVMEEKAVRAGIIDTLVACHEKALNLRDCS